MAGSTETTPATKKEYRIVPPPPAEGKSIYVPGKVWVNSDRFLKDFPFTRTALLMLIVSKLKPLYVGDYEDTGKMYLGSKKEAIHCNADSGTVKCDYVTVPIKPYLGVTVWEYGNKIKTYTDIIRFAISPQYPLMIDLNIVSKSQLERMWKTYAESEGLEGDNSKSFRRMLAGFTGWYIASNKVKRALKKIPVVGYAKKYEKVFTDWLLKYAVRGFKVRTPSEYKTFEEVYGKYSTVSNVPANTIAYTVTGKAPPVPKGVAWNTVDFWSAIFNTHMGSVMLNAVGNNMPVSIVTKLNIFQNILNTDKTITGRNKTIFSYVFQDFSIEVGKNNNILISYNLGKESVTIIKYKSKAWLKILIFIAIVIIVIVAVAVLAPAAAGAAAAGAGGTGIATAPVTLGSVTAPGVTLGTVAPTMSVGTGVAAGSESVLAAAAPSILESGAGLTVSEVIGGAGTVVGAGGKVYSLVEQKKAQKEADKLRKAQAARNAALTRVPVPGSIPAAGNKFPFSSSEMLTAAGISIPIIIIGSLIYKKVK